MNIEVPEEVFQVHGHAPPKKAEGTIRLIYQNINGLCNRMIKNKNLDRARAIHYNLEVNIVASCKHQLNMRHRLNGNGFNQLFKRGEATIHSIAVHNIHKNFRKNQQGGTSLMLFGPITEQLDFERSGKDNTGLGRWTVMTLQGDGVQTRNVCSYTRAGMAS